jgi:hypothetical protein
VWIAGRDRVSRCNPVDLLQWRHLRRSVCAVPGRKRAGVLLPISVASWRVPRCHSLLR